MEARWEYRKGDVQQQKGQNTTLSHSTGQQENPSKYKTKREEFHLIYEANIAII